MSRRNRRGGPDPRSHSGVDEGMDDQARDSMTLTDMSLLPKIGQVSLVKWGLILILWLAILLPGAFNFSILPQLFLLDMAWLFVLLVVTLWTPTHMGVAEHAAVRSRLRWGQRVIRRVNPREYEYNRDPGDYRRHADGSESESEDHA